MKLYFYKEKGGNFGDDLNEWLWPKIFPDLLEGTAHHAGALREANESESELFVGIGTLINDHMPSKPTKYIFGSGAGYGPKPDLDSTWKFFAVRGPLTAESLGLEKKLAITDAAILVQLFTDNNVKKVSKYSYMPHQMSTNCGNWEKICKNLGINFISPCGDVWETISQIQSTEVLLTEAMHGAIVADAVRTPWIPIKAYDFILDFKWHDWTSSMNLNYQPNHIASLWDNSDNQKSGVRRALKKKLVTRQFSKIIKSTFPQLSSDNTNSVLLERYLEKVALLKEQFQ